MSVSRERLLGLATESGYRPEILEKVIRLGEILADIGRHPLLSRALALKGGTALNLFFGPPARLSVDLDLNYVASAERAVMLRDRPEVEGAIAQVARGRGYRLQWSREEHAGRKAFLGYLGAAGTPDRIEIDLNFLFRLPLATVQNLAMWQPGNLERPETPVVGFEELAAGKLSALLDRALPRDLFDTIGLPERARATWGTRRFRRLFIAIAGILNHPLHDYGRDRLDRVTDTVVSDQLHPMLIRGNEPSASELRGGAWSVVAPLLDLDEAEREYTDRLQIGELAPEVLFPDEGEMAERLRRHPALLWKAQNARQHAARKAGGRPRSKG